MPVSFPISRERLHPESLARELVKTMPTITLPLPPSVNAIWRTWRGRVRCSKRTAHQVIEDEAKVTSITSRWDSTVPASVVLVTVDPQWPPPRWGHGHLVVRTTDDQAFATHRLVITDLKTGWTAPAYLGAGAPWAGRCCPAAAASLPWACQLLRRPPKFGQRGIGSGGLGEVSRVSSHANAPPPSHWDGCE